MPEKKAYIEHWGKENDPKYNEQKNYKLDKYKKMKITVICTHENTDSEDIESALNRKLNNFKIGKVNYE